MRRLRKRQSSEIVAARAVRKGVTEVCGPQHPIDRPGLTADLGGEPARQYGDEWQWKAQKYRPEQQTILLDASFDAQIDPTQASNSMSETAADHDAKREERNDHRRPILQRETVHSDLPAVGVGVDQAAEGRGKRDREEVSLVPRIRPCEQDLEAGFSSCQRASIAAIFDG